MQETNGRGLVHSGSHPFGYSASIILVLIVALQCCLFVVAGSQRQEFHIDEIYSYVIANSTEADRISHADWLLSQWVSGVSFDELVTVQPGEALNFAAAYRNTSTDAHPPLYYWALHAACALVPGIFTAWTGIALNVACFAVMQVFVYLIARELLGDRGLALVPVALWGFSGLALGMVEFIRMYALLGALAMAFTWLSIRIARRGVSARTLLPACAVLYLGGMTQYYFLIYAFWLALMLGIHLLRKRRPRQALAYGLSALAAVTLVLVSFPAAISQVTGSSTNNVGNEVARSLFDLGLWVEKTAGLVRDAVLGISLSPLVAKASAALALVMLAAATATALRSKRAVAQEDEKAEDSQALEGAPSAAWVALWLTAAFALSFLSIAKIGGEYVYLRYVWFVMPLVFVVWTYAVRGLTRSRATRIALATVCLVFSVINAALVIVRGDDSYTYASTAQMTSEVTAHSDAPLVFILEGEGTAALTGNFTTIRQFDDVFVSSLETVEQSDVITQAIAQGGSCVVYIAQHNSWTSGYVVEDALAQLAQSAPELQWSLISDQSMGDYYLLTLETS